MDTPNSDRDPEDDPERHVHSVKTIDGLPAEILEEILNSLTHTEKLISRLVCQKWKGHISSMLTKHSYYSLTSNESLKVLLDSHDGGMQWSKIKSSYHGFGFVLPLKFKNFVTTLEVRMPRFRSRLSEYVKFLAEFPCLTTLKMSVDGGGYDDSTKVETDDEYFILNGYLKMAFEKLKNLTITVPFYKYFVLCDFFARISIEKITLNTLHITEERQSSAQIVNYDYFHYRNQRYSDYFLKYVYRIIRNSVHTLKSLTLDFSTKSMQIVLFEKAVPHFNRYCEFLKLQSVRIRRGRFSDNAERDFSNLQELLQKRTDLGKLKNVLLPRCPDASLCQEFVRCLPSDIDFVGNVHNEHITDEFPTNFKKLKTLSIRSDVTKQLYSAPDRHIRRLEIDMGGFQTRTFEPQSLYQNLANNVNNLSEIRIDGNNILIFDSHLRQIIKELSNHLRVLHLESCRISDFGVLGVPEDDVELQELIRTKRIYNHQTPNENLFPKVAQPLSHLRMLEKLVLIGTNITDVGIILGFKFGLKLKQLILTSKSPEVTDFGLYSLGSNNPGLEVFQGSFKSGKIPTVGIEKLKKQLPLAEFTRKFKMVNKNQNQDTDIGTGEVFISPSDSRNRFLSTPGVIYIAITVLIAVCACYMYY